MVGILDTMRAIDPDVSTVAMGNCSSTATVLLVGVLSAPRCNHQIPLQLSPRCRRADRPLVEQFAGWLCWLRSLRRHHM